MLQSQRRDICALPAAYQISSVKVGHSFEIEREAVSNLSANELIFLTIGTPVGEANLFSCLDREAPCFRKSQKHVTGGLTLRKGDRAATLRSRRRSCQLRADRIPT